MLPLPPAHLRAITTFYAQIARTGDAATQARLEAAVDIALRRAPKADPHIGRNARRDGAITAVRQAQRLPVACELDNPENVNSAAHGDRRAGPEREAIFREELRRLESLLAARSGRARQVLACWADDMNVAETACAMGISEGRVKQLRRLVKAVALAELPRPSSI